MALTITMANFDEMVIKSSKPVLIDFWASWCGPCRTVAPTIDRLSKEFDGKAIVGKVNVDEEQALAEKFRIMSIPSIYIFKNGQVVERMVGARTAEELSMLLQKHI